jgi:tRNA U34 5-methylaminomethyl-2-thiouridine-forming methyltransferase MnmC
MNEVLSETPGQKYQLVQLRNGAFAVYSADYDEKMHPGLGPAAEAEELHVKQLRIRERLANGAGEFVVWDIGLGAGANALTLLKLTRDIQRPLRLISFDDTSGFLEFALQHVDRLPYLSGFENACRTLLQSSSVRMHDAVRGDVRWDFVRGDFPAWIACRASVATVPSPDAVMFDAFSPARNPTMWTLPMFRNLYAALDPRRPCNLSTYSRSTMVRATLLLAGLFVGRGFATGMKEETTVAANARSLIESPLDARWLERAGRSDSAEPLDAPAYRQMPLAAGTLAALRAHGQFRNQV